MQINMDKFIDKNKLAVKEEFDALCRSISHYFEGSHGHNTPTDFTYEKNGVDYVGVRLNTDKNEIMVTIMGSIKGIGYSDEQKIRDGLIDLSKQMKELVKVRNNWSYKIEKYARVSSSLTFSAVNDEVVADIVHLLESVDFVHKSHSKSVFFF